MKHIYQPFAICRYFLVILVLSSLFIHTAKAQVTPNINSGNPTFPFPQFLDYANNDGKLENLGTKAAPGLTHADMENSTREAYQIICNRIIKTGETVAGVEYLRQGGTDVPNGSGDPCTCAEADGYYLLAAAYMADKVTFDGLYMQMHDRALHRVKRYIDGQENSPDYPYSTRGNGAGNKLAPHSTLGGAAGDNNNVATDGDVDIALALLVAYVQWGEHSKIILNNHGWNNHEISYKEEARLFIGSLADTLLSSNKLGELPHGRRYLNNGVIGMDGYFKDGDSQNELSTWFVNGTSSYKGINYVEYPGTKGGGYVDYYAPSYARQFADWFEKEGFSPWCESQFRRAEASSDWIMGQHFKNNPKNIPLGGHVKIDEGNHTATVTDDAPAEDVRHPWRHLMNYVWHGNPTYTWNPVTHEIINSPNSFEYDMGVRYSEFLKDARQTPWSLPCDGDTAKGSNWLTYFGPAALQTSFNVDGSNRDFFFLNWIQGTSSPAAIIAQDTDLMAKMYRQCEITFDAAQINGGYPNQVPVYFHEWFRLLGMLVLSGNYQAPLFMENPQSNVRVYLDVDKTFAYTGDIIEYTVSYRNYASVPASNIQISDVLPPEIEFVSSSIPGIKNGSDITWNIGSLSGFNGSNLSAVTGEFTFKARITGKTGIVKNTLSISNSNGPSFVSNEYPNEASYTMKRNWVDIANRSLVIDKFADNDRFNPGDEATFTIAFENTSEAGFLNGGRPDVTFSYAHNLNATSASEMPLDFRLFHDAHEAYIDYSNYRLAYYVNSGVTCAEGEAGCVNGWKAAIDYYEGGDKSLVLLTREDITPGSDGFGSWNQKINLQFAPEIATTSAHLKIYSGQREYIHKGGLKPLYGQFQLHTNYVTQDWGDDWSFDPNAKRSGDLLFPVNQDWSDPDNVKTLTSWGYNSCNTAGYTVDRVLVEEFDGYVWRRVAGNSPLPGRDVDNVVIIDTLPKGLKFKNFIGSNPFGIAPVLTTGVDHNGETVEIIQWSIPRLKIAQKSIIQYTATVSFPSAKKCSTADEEIINKAYISGSTESLVFADDTITVTCKKVVICPTSSNMTFTANKSTYEVGEIADFAIEYTQTDGSINDVDFSDPTQWIIESPFSIASNKLISSGGDEGIAVIAVNKISYGKNTLKDGISGHIDMDQSTKFSLLLRSGGISSSDGILIEFYAEYASISINVFDSGTLRGTKSSITDSKIIINGNNDNKTRFDFRVTLVENEIEIWIGDIVYNSKVKVSDLTTLSPGFVGFVNGNSDQQHGIKEVTKLKTHLDYAYQLSLSTNLSSGIIDPESISNSGFFDAVNSVIHWSIDPEIGQTHIPYNTEIVRSFSATYSDCSEQIVLSYANSLGLDLNQIGACLTINCGTTPPVTCTPPASAIISGDDLIVEGSSTVLTATIAPVETGWLYNWYKLPNTTTPLAGSGLDKTTLTVSDSGRYVVRVLSSSTPSCFVGSSEHKLSYIETCTARDSVVVTLSALLEPGETSTLTATPYPAGADLNYQWYKLPNLTTPLAGSGLDKTTISVSDTGKYIVKLIDPSDPSCEVASRITQVDYLCEKAVIKAFWNGEEITEPYAINLCEGESGVLAFAPQKYNFEYDIRQLTGTPLLDGVPTPAGDSAKVTISSSNVGSWLLSVYADPGNTGKQLCWTVTDTKFLTINKTTIPVPTITATPDSKYCAGENGVTLTANTGVGYTYIWSKDGIEQALGPDPNVQSNATAGNWKVNVMAGGLCADSTTLDVLEEAKPIAEFTTSAPNLSYCPGSPGTNLIAKAASGMQYQFFKDNLPAGPFSTTETQIADEGTWHVVFENAFGCKDASNVVVVTQSSNITVEIVGDTTICSGQTLSLSTNLGSQTITWTLPDNSTQEVSDLVVLNPQSGLYKAYYEDGAGCNGKDSVNVLIEPASPNPIVSILDKSPKGCFGDTLIFTAQIIDAIDPIIEWYINSDKQSSVIGEFKSSALQDGDKVKVLITSESTCNGIQKVGDSVLVVINPSPIIEVSSATTSICEGESVSLDGTSSNTTLDVFEWLKDGNSFSTLPNSVSVSSGGSYSLKGTDIHGCSGLSNALVIEEISLPIATINSPVTGVCSGSQIDISSDVTDQSYTYSWIDASDTDLGISGPVATISSPGSYRMVLKSGNCTSISNTVIIEDLVLETPLIYGNNTPLCEAEGETYTVTNLLSNAQYTWSLPDGAQIVNQNGGIAIVNLSDQDGVISVYATNSLGCESPVGEIPISLQLCGFKANIDFDKTSICPGETVIFESKSTGVSSGTTYQWNFGANATPSTYNQVGPIPVVFNEPGLVQVSLTITEGGISDTYTITDKIRVYSNPDISDITGPGMICLNTEAEFSATVSVDVQVQWSLSNNLVNQDLYTSSTIKVKANQTGIGIIKAYALDMKGCYSETVEKSVTIEDKPSISLSSDRNMLCNGGEAILVASSSGNDLQWYKDGQYLMNESGDQLIVNTPGKYWVSIGSGNCIASDTVYIDQSGLAVDAGKDQMIDIGQSTQLLAISNSPSVFYHWEPSLSSLPAPTVSPYESTLYTVFVTDEHGCQANDDVLVRVVEPLFIPNAFTPNGDGVHDLWEISGLERFPNLSVEIFNRWGQLVYKSTGTYKPWDGTRNGVMMPVSTYYYVIDGGGSSTPITGAVLLSK